MASAVTEVLSWIVSVIGPAAGDPRTAASVRTPLGQLASRTKWLRRFQQLLFGAEQAVSAVDATADTLTIASHGFSANQAVRLFATDAGSLPGGLAYDVVYYVDVVDGDTIKLSASSGPGSAVNLTAGFAGPVWICPIPDWTSEMLLYTTSYGAGKLTSLVGFLAGSQTFTGAKTFADLTMSGTNYVKLASRSLTRAVPATFVDNTTEKAYRLPAVIDNVNAQGTISLPHGAVLNTIAVTIDPANLGGLPGDPPSVTISRVPINSSTPVGLGTQADVSLDVGSYNAVHDIEITSIGHTIDNTANTYRIEFNGSSDGIVTVIAVKATVTIAGMRDWA